jgi:hypothetical protein
MVTRAVRTECGPAALICWLGQCAGSPRALTEDLVRVLFEQPDAMLAETIDDS